MEFMYLVRVEFMYLLRVEFMYLGRVNVREARVTVGDSGLCCCVCVTAFGR